MHDFFKTFNLGPVDGIIVLAVIVATTETFAQTLVKTHQPVDVWFGVGLWFYVIVGLLLHYAYDSFPISKFNTIWSSMSIIIATALGYAVYNEKIGTNNIISVIFAILAIYFSNL